MSKIHNKTNTNPVSCGKPRSFLFRVVSLLYGILILFLMFGLFWADYYPFEIFSHFLPHYFFCQILALPIFILARKWVWLYTGLFLCLLNGFYFLPGVLFKAPARLYNVKGNGTCRVVSLNLLSSNTSHTKVLDFINKTAPRIIFFMEVNKRWAAQLESLKTDFPYSLVDAREDNFGVALFSKIPVDNLVYKFFSPLALPAISGIFKLDSHYFQLMGCHTLPPVSKSAFNDRNKYLTNLSKFVQRQKIPTVILGDFNVTSFSPYFRKFLASSHLMDSRGGFGYQGSWPAGCSLLSIPIDHVFVSDRIDVTRRVIGPQVGSDHLPVVIDFAIR